MCAHYRIDDSRFSESIGRVGHQALELVPGDALYGVEDVRAIIYIAALTLPPPEVVLKRSVTATRRQL